MSRLSRSNSSGDNFGGSNSASIPRSDSSASGSRSRSRQELSNKRSRSSLSDSGDEQNDDTVQVIASNTRNVHLHIDSLSKELNLNSKQAADLHKLATHVHSFRSDELLFRLTELANTFKSQNLLNEVLVKCANTEKYFRDLRFSNGSKWSLNEDQNANLLVLVKQVMFEAKFPKYGQLNQYVKIMAERKAVTLGFVEAFDGNANRLRIFVKELGAKCRNVKGQFKGHIKEFTFGPKRLVFVKFCEEMATKYSQKGSLNIPKEQKDRLALLRRYARVHPDILGAEDDNDGEEEMSADESQPASDADENVPSRTYRRSHNRSSNKRKSTGRALKGKDWWSQVDLWLAKLDKKFGEDKDGIEWKSFMSETYEMEDQAYASSEQFANFDQVFGQNDGHRSSSALPAIGGQYSTGASSEGQSRGASPSYDDLIVSRQNSPNYAGTPPSSQFQSLSGSDRGLAFPQSTPASNIASHGLPRTAVFTRGNIFPPARPDTLPRLSLNGPPANYDRNDFPSPTPSYAPPENREYHPPQSGGIAMSSLQLPAILSNDHGNSQNSGFQNWAYGSNGDAGQRLSGSASSIMHDGTANFSGQHAEMAGRFD